MLVRHATTARPETHALLALMLFHAARSEARLDDQGAIVLLQDQDRGKWDQRLIALADHHLHQASQGAEISSYHIEAAIASVHAHSPTFDHTDWGTIVTLYDRLLAITPSAIVRFNRAIALGRAQGAAAGLKALEAVEGLERSHLFHAAHGDLLRDLSRIPEAREAYDSAVALARSATERALLKKKIRDLGAALS